MRMIDKRVIITAAASGMGRAGSIRFAAEGAKIAAVDIDQNSLNETIDEIRNAGGEAHGILADLSNSDSCRSSMIEARNALGGIDVLWAHAGCPGPTGIEEVELDQYEQTMDLNVRSAFLTAAEVIKPMRVAGGGSIIFTASIGGLVGSMLSPVYSATKSAIVGMTRSMAYRLAKENIRVNTICPGLTDTPMLPKFLSRGADAAQSAKNTEKYRAEVPMGRLAKPEEIASAVLFLASDDASYVTGISLPVDGGFICH